MRLGSSLRADIEKKFGINVNPKDDNAQVKVQAVLEKAKIVVSASFSLHSNSLERSNLIYDTVIIDDANMVSEADTITALKHGCQRAIFLGNQMLEQSMFLIN